MNKEQLTAELVNKLTGLNIHSPEGKRLVLKAKYTLAYEKCTSTSEKEVNDSINGLADKFKIKGHSQISTALLDQKYRFLDKMHPLGSKHTNQSILKYDMLRLLLCLSSSSNQLYDYTNILPNNTEKEVLTWEDVIKEDPLEGDHWKSWPEDSSNDDYSDDDGYEFKQQITAGLQQQKSIDGVDKPNLHNIKCTDRMQIDSRGDHDTLGYLRTQQYWRDDFNMNKESFSDGNLLQNSCQLCDSLSGIYYRESERRQMKTINESDIIREITSLLRGYHGVLYKYIDNQFQLDKHYLVQHLSRKALGSLLNEFCIYGNIISELRQIVTRVANDAKYGQTSQALAATIYKSLMEFEGQLSDIESNTSLTTCDPTQSISVLKIRNTLDFSLKCFRAMHEIVMNTPFPDSDPQLISTYLISTFYDRALISQSSGQLIMYDTFLYVLEEILIPYGRIIDDWIFYGSLTSDRAKEFYVSRNKDIPEDSPNFWMNGFRLQPVKLENVCFLCPLFDQDVMSSVFFMGKAVNLLSQVKKSLKNIKLEEISSSPFANVMNEYLARKPSFITYNKMKPLQSISADVDPLTSALFPLKNAKNMDKFNDFSDPLNDIGFLFDQDFVQFIEKYTEKPYKYAAGTLTEVLHSQCRLSEQLSSLSSIYLMLENDLMHSFCEALFQKIDANEPWFDERVMSRTFSEACETSGYDEIVYIKLKDIMAEGGVFKSPTVASYLELIDFKVEIPWPLNNFIQASELGMYSKIVNLLLRLKRAKFVMEKKTLFRGRHISKKSDHHAMRFYSIRMKILWFINAFYRYIMTTILHAETIDFRDKLSISKDADEITALHTSYVRKIVDRCLLNDKSSGIKKSIINVFDIAEQMANLFCRYMQLQDGEENEAEDLKEFSQAMNIIEKDFSRLNEFITISLMILGKKGNLPWFESLATSLSSQ